MLVEGHRTYGSIRIGPTDIGHRGTGRPGVGYHPSLSYIKLLDRTFPERTDSESSLSHVISFGPDFSRIGRTLEAVFLM